MAEIDLNEALAEAVGTAEQHADDNPAAAGGENADAAPHEEGKVDKPEDHGEEPKSDKGAGNVTLDDELVERAVKAGLSLADAKAFSSKEMAERIITALEAKSAPSATQENSEGEDGDDLSSIEAEYTEDNGYEEGVCRSMRTLVKTIREMKAARNTAADADFFSSQFSGLDEKVRSHVDAIRKSQLKSKFDMLEAGYKAVKANVKREDVFKEAVNLALGDLVQKASEEGKTQKLEQRRKLAVARPGGENGARKAADGPMTNEQIVEELFAHMK